MCLGASRSGQKGTVSQESTRVSSGKSPFSKLFADASAIALTAFISPYRADRAVARELHDKAGLTFIEVFVDAPLSVVEERDPKGLYKKARAGEIKGASFLHRPLPSKTHALTLGHADFTGISAPYEAPESPEVHIKTDECDVKEAVARITEYLSSKGLI